MKSRFSTIDIVAVLSELQSLVGMRVNQVYDIDNKTYLLRLNRYEEKVVLLLESGIRIHTTEFEWPKNPSPSGFSMKMRKHIKNKRLERIQQLGLDRILDLQFGTNDAAYHIILELYDRGNIVLTDFEYTILNILRPRASGSEDVKFIVREKYPLDRARSADSSFNHEEIKAALEDADDGTPLKKILMPLVVYGPALLEHVLAKNGFSKNCAINKSFSNSSDSDRNRLFTSLEEADTLMKEISTKCDGYVIHKTDKNTTEEKEIVTNIEFHPYLFHQLKDMRYTQYPTFNKAVDYYFSGMEGQKIDLKAFQKEKEALKKLENVKKDHEQRLVKLTESQTEDIKKAQLIEMNLELVEKAILVIRSAIANQISWSDIQDLIKEAQLEGDPVAKAIKKLKLDINHFTLLLMNPQFDSEDDESKPQLVDIDLDCSAYANARKYYDLKRAHAKKEQKTLESSEKAFKNAERKTKQALKEVAVSTSITKARKVLWFEKFLWFISSENYLIIAGRDVQQNEMLVKKYLKTNDLYVHADLHGASSLIIKNPKASPVPPKTLNEAGTMAVCSSSAWDSKMVCSAWWVHANQVSKTAPSGEYLTTGSFMIRGKKNFLPPAYLIMGFAFLFRLDDESAQHHVNERCERVEEETFNSKEETFKPEEETFKPEEEEKVEDVSSPVDSGDDESDVSEKEEMAQLPENTEENADDSDDSLNEEISYPDTEVKLNVLGKVPSEQESTEKNTGEVVIKQHIKKDVKDPEKNQPAPSAEKQGVLKRGQRSKLKKIKKKYKYQDEEERELRMKILASAGQPKEDKKSKKKKSSKASAPPNKQRAIPKTLHFIEIPEEEPPVEDKGTISDQVLDPKQAEIQKGPEVSDDEEEDNQMTDELQLLNSLTGSPLPEDTLLYAVPVCAPYAAVLSFKYKLKIIPGSNRRGKAAKTALGIFLHEKSASQREKDLLRSLKDQDISRNLPGKVKISAPNYKKVK